MATVRPSVTKPAPGTPYTGLPLWEDGSRSWRTGPRWQVVPEATRQGEARRMAPPRGKRARWFTETSFYVCVVLDNFTDNFVNMSAVTRTALEVGRDGSRERTHVPHITDERAKSRRAAGSWATAGLDAEGCSHYRKQCSTGPKPQSVSRQARPAICVAHPGDATSNVFPGWERHGETDAGRVLRRRSASSECR